jgi:hypothetical protein
MKIVVSSCKYSSILPLFAKQFNKYFPTDHEVIVLSPSEITGLPDNFSVVKIDYSTSWVNDVSGFFKDFEDEIFLGCMEDHFLYSVVDNEFLKRCISLFEDSSVIKFCGTRHTLQPSAIWDRGDRTVHQYEDSDLLYDAPVKQSLMPGIWRTEFFNYMLEQSEDWNAWEFEVRKNGYHLEPHILDHIKDKKVVFSSTTELYSMSDVIRGGQPAMNHWERVVKDPDDIAVFREATERVFPNVLWST